MEAPRLSTGFLCVLAGIGMTVLAWFGPWEWPAWPAFFALDLFLDRGTWYEDLPFAWRAVVLILLIVMNSGSWALLFCALTNFIGKSWSRSA